MINLTKQTTLLVLSSLLIAGCTFTQPKNSTPTESELAQEQTSPTQNYGDASGTEATTAFSENGRYVEYSPTALEDAATSRRVLFFYAAWCPTCQPADQDFKNNSEQIPADVTVIRVNYNDNDTDTSEKDLAQKYAVTYQHTYVQIDANGEAVKVWNGGQLEELLKNIE